MKKKEKEIGIPKSAPAHIKALDAKLDKIHGTKEGSKEDLKMDKAVMKAHKDGKKMKIEKY